MPAIASVFDVVDQNELLHSHRWILLDLFIAVRKYTRGVVPFLSRRPELHEAATIRGQLLKVGLRSRLRCLGRIRLSSLHRKTQQDGTFKDGKNTASRNSWSL
jgi:hypothetical protein